MAHDPMISDGLRLRHRLSISRYAAAAVFVLLAVLARQLLEPVLGDREPFPTFYVSVTAAAWWGGPRATLFALVLVGLAFAWWARIHLGRLWSSSVTRKAGHRVVDSGPYAVVRHPIYTGLLLSIAATAAEQGSVRAILGLLAFIVGFSIKARLEERFLSAELGPGDYEGYRRRVPMLIPFGPPG